MPACHPWAPAGLPPSRRIDDELRRSHHRPASLNSLTKYPSIPTYHTLDPKNGGLLDGTVPFTGPVLATEKVDGCLTRTTRVSMADGSRKLIKDVAVGDEVLGMDEEGRVVPTPVVNVFNNGRAETWMKISGRRLGAGRGNSQFSITCTPNHRFWIASRDEYVAAEKLADGDEVTLLRSELDLTPCQRSVLLGKLLGDGTLAVRKGSRTAAVEWGHRVQDSAYVEWTLLGLGDMASSAINERTSGYGSTMVRARSSFHPVCETTSAT